MTITGGYHPGRPACNDAEGSVVGMFGKMIGAVASVPAGMVRSFESVPGIGHAVSSANAEIFELLGAIGAGAGQLPEPPEVDPAVA